MRGQLRSSSTTTTTATRMAAGNQRRSSRRQRREQHLLDVNVRSHIYWQQHRRRIFTWLSTTVLIVGVAAGSWLGGREVLRRYFWENPDYSLAQIEAKTDGPLTREQIMDAAGVREGMNIFSVNIAEARKGLLALAQVERAEVERVLPNRLSMEISERKPVAWVAAKVEDDPSAGGKSFLVDRKGVLMRSKSRIEEYLRLPVICGVTLENFEPGDSAQTPELKAALDLLRLTGDNPARFQVRSIDVSKGYCLIVTDQRHARITFGIERVDQQLERLGALLEHIERNAGGREIQTVNLLVQRNVPVTFMPPPEPEPAAEASPTPAAHTLTKDAVKASASPSPAAAAKVKVPTGKIFAAKKSQPVSPKPAPKVRRAEPVRKQRIEAPAPTPAPAPAQTPVPVRRAIPLFPNIFRSA